MPAAAHPRRCRVAPDRGAGKEGAPMDHVYKVSEVVGSSSEGIEAAIRNAVARTADSVRNLRWFEMVSVRGHVEGGAVAHWQVTIKVGFTVEG
jgi:dodecin